MSGIQTILNELIAQSLFGQTGLASLFGDLALANPFHTEAILIELVLYSIHATATLDTQSSKLEVSLLSPSANNNASNPLPQQLSQIQATISNLSNKVFQTKRPVEPTTTNPAPPSKKGKKTFAEAVKFVPPKDNTSTNAPRQKVPTNPKDTKEKTSRPLPTAERRFFASRSSASAFNESVVLAAALPVVVSCAIRAAKFPTSHSVVLSVTINDRGTVTFTANPLTPAFTFVLYFAAILKTLNKSCLIGDNPFNPVHTAPTDVNVAIHNIPTFALTSEPKELSNTLSETILYAADIKITSCNGTTTPLPAVKHNSTGQAER